MGLALDIGYATVLTAASPWLALRAARTGRYREGWSQRLLGRIPKLAENETSIWFHGVSLGEVQLLKPLVEHFQRIQDTHQVVLSTSTLTGMEVARRSATTHAPFYCPLDFTWAVKESIARVNPRLIVLGELEVWPNLIASAHQQNIPVAVINGRLSDRSFRGYYKFKRWIAPTFERLSLVAAQDETTAERFRALGVAADRIHVAGSLKFDNVSVDAQRPEVIRLRELMGLKNHHRVFVAGSTQDPEEAAALAATSKLLDRFPDMRLIVVPRHPERFDEVDALLRRSELKVLRRSQINESVTADQWQVLLVDTVGELKWWWGLAELALVGGSFGTRGGQNMLEPAAYGAKVAFGPNVSNFRQIVSMLKEKDAVWQLPTLDALPAWIDDHMSHPEIGRDKTARAVELIRSHQGALVRTCNLLQPLLKTT